MDKDPDRRFSIPLERSVQPRKPGRWIPVIWLLFAVALTVAIIGVIQSYVPIADEDRENASAEEISAAEPMAPPPAPAKKPAPAPVTPAPSPSAPVPESTPALAVGAPARLTEKTEAVLREGQRVRGFLTLQPGTEVVVQEVLPEGRYRVSWRDAEAETAASALEPLTP